MIVYLLKSVACLALLYVFYRLFLEKENMHVFKRFYLLGALVFSLVVPALVFTEYVEVPAAPQITYAEIEQAPITEEIIGVPQALEADVLDIAPLLWGIYFIGLFFFGLKFIRNLFQIFRRIRKNPKQKSSRFTQVLLQEKITPHTFFSYIFLNKKKFEADQIPTEVLLHEETHARQKHSWDVILVELLHVIFWINPFIYLTKKAIKLNHEFLADEAVLKQHIDENTYKNTLLSYLSHDSKKKYQPLANAINYSSIKKRFTIMKTHTSKKAMIFRSLLLLPFLAILIYGFSTSEIIEKNQEPTIEENVQSELKRIDKLELRKTRNEANQPTQNNLKEWKNSAKYAIWIDSKNVPNKALNNYQATEFVHYTKSFVYKNARSKRFPQAYQLSLYTNATYAKHQAYKNSTIEISINKSGKILIRDEFGIVGLSEVSSIVQQQLAIKDVKQAILEIDINAPTKLVVEVESILEAYNIPEIKKVGVENSFQVIQKQGVKQQSHLNPPPPMDTIFTYQHLAKRIITIEKNRAANIIYLKSIYSKMSSEQKEKVKSPEIITNNLLKRGATEEQLEEYNTWAKKLHDESTKLSDTATFYPPISQKDLMKFYEIYKRMSPQQKTNAVEFPFSDLDFEDSQQKKATDRQITEYNALAKKYNAMLAESKSIQIKMKDVERLKYIYGLMSDKQKAEAEPFPDFPEPPPTPIAPESPKAKKVESKDIPRPPSPKGRIFSIGKFNISPGSVHVKAGKSELREGIDYSVDYQLGRVQILDKTIKHTNTPIKVFIENENKSMELQEIIEHQDPNKISSYSNSPEPPIPPKPIEPIDHVIEMAKKKATFYYEGKEITSDTAIELLKKNKNLNIDSRSVNGKKPVVKISKKPIKILR